MEYRQQHFIEESARTGSAPSASTRSVTIKVQVLSAVEAFSGGVGSFVSGRFANMIPKGRRRIPPRSRCSNCWSFSRPRVAIPLFEFYYGRRPMPDPLASNSTKPKRRDTVPASSLARAFRFQRRDFGSSGQIKRKGTGNQFFVAGASHVLGKRSHEAKYPLREGRVLRGAGNGHEPRERT